MTDKLVLYFSRNGENYVNGTVKNLPVGNCELAADFIADAIGADKFRIEPLEPYPQDYYDLIEIAQNEYWKKSRPALKRELKTIEPYKDIYIVGPVWWGSYPMAMYTQLEKLDFHGKNIHSYVSHEGSGLADTQKDLKKMLKGASFSEPIAVLGSQTKDSQTEIEVWAKQEI